MISQHKSYIVALFLLTTVCGVAGAQQAQLSSGECVIRPHSTVELSSAVPGIIETVSFERSDKVRKGDVVARLESEVERMDVEVAAARAGMESDIGLSEESLAYDERNRRRLAELRRTRAVAELEHDRASRDSRLSQWKLNKARELNGLRKIQLARARAVLRRRAVVSPIDGFILERHKSPGEFVEDEPIVTVVQLDPLRVEAVFSLAAFSGIRRGDKAVVTVETGAEKTYPATVSVVDRVADAASGTLTVRLEMPNPEFAVPAGIKCQVTVEPVAKLATPLPSTSAPTHAPSMSVVPADEKVVERPGPLTPVPERRSVSVGLDDTGPLDDAICEAYGPVPNARAAAQALERIKPGAAHAQIISRRVPRTTGYAVIADAPADGAGTRALVRALHERGIEDVAVSRRASGGAEVSLGFYVREAGAKARVNALQALNVAASIATRSSLRPMWWVALESSTSDDTVLTRLRPLQRDPAFKCDQQGLITAGR